MKRYPALFVLIAAFLIAGCDTGPSELETPPEPFFEATLSGAMEASIEGMAALNSNPNFDAGTFFVFDLPPAAFFPGETITAIQLRSTQGETTHEISLLYFGEDALSPGTYDATRPPLNFEECRDADDPPRCMRAQFYASSFFSTHYRRQTADSLYSYLFSSYQLISSYQFSGGEIVQNSGGEIVIETASDAEISGALSLEAAAVMVVSRADMQAFHEAMRDWDGDMEDLPLFPGDVRPLSPALHIEGSFTAAPADLPPLTP